MADKNNLVEVAGSDVLAKTGHGIIKAIYVNPTDRTWIIRDGTSVSGTALFTVGSAAAANGPISMPYINHPCSDGIFVDNTTAGTVGTLVIVFE